TWVLLEASRRSPTVKQIIHASSDKAYGSHQRVPYTEDTPLRGQHPYDVSKSCADLLAQAYATSYALPVATTRCGNFYGGGDLNWNRIVPGTIRSVLRGERPVIRSDGQCLRDYLYIEDGVRAYLTLAEALAGQPSLAGESFNFGQNAPVRVLDIVREIAALRGREDLEPEILSITENEIPCQHLDSSKAQRMLDWQPQFSLKEGLARTISWYRHYLTEKQ
ncbi:MAG: GDP-mannose 4,6-dehydratase, partial [Dehalococcoidia bacterium]